MSDRVKRVETFTITIPREVPYLGELAADEQPNARGYFIRRGNRTVYPTVDRSVIVRIETNDGAVGWGETYGIVSPGAVREIIEDLLADFVSGRDPLDVSVIHEDLYDLMHVRGYTSGFYLDALAAIDIGLWDLCGKLHGMPLAKLLKKIASTFDSDSDSFSEHRTTWFWNVSFYRTKFSLRAGF